MDKNERGFKYLKFKDCGYSDCSIQESSSAMEPRIWLGFNKITPMLFLPDVSDTQTGLIKYPLPPEVQINGRMELNQDMVKELLPLLTYFAENGCLPE